MPAARTIDIRRQVFGDANTDETTGRPHRDRAVASWLGVSTFALGISGYVILLDAWIPRGLARPQVALTPAGLAALTPDLVLVGHGHFDHAADLPRVAESAATVVASPTVLQRVPESGARRVAAARSVGEVRIHDDLLDDLEVTSVGHIHSAPVAPSGGRRPLVPIPDPRTIIRRPPRLRDAGHLLAHLADRAGPCVLYVLRSPGFSFAWHDTSGPLPERAPEILDVLAELGPVDVASGALMGFNQFTNGLRDVGLYVQALQPRIFVPNHHDDWLPPLTGRSGRYRRPLSDELSRFPDTSTETQFLGAPTDYLRPLVWHLGGSER